MRSDLTSEAVSLVSAAGLLLGPKLVHGVQKVLGQLDFEAGSALT